ncbi:MAG: helix-turn-helix domain-containing protein [Solirubrobacteraceae bacterium]
MLGILLAGETLGAEVLARVQAAGHPDVRYAHGFLFQVLVPGPRTVGDVAAALGISSQAVSKAVAELEALGYVERRADPADARRRLLALTARGQDAVQAGRDARAALGEELAAAIGPERAAAAAAAIADGLEARGAMDAIRARRVRPAAGG